jgi:hypothetical protein
LILVIPIIIIIFSPDLQVSLPQPYLKPTPYSQLLACSLPHLSSTLATLPSLATFQIPNNLFRNFISFIHLYRQVRTRPINQSLTHLLPNSSDLIALHRQLSPHAQTLSRPGVKVSAAWDSAPHFFGNTNLLSHFCRLPCTLPEFRPSAVLFRFRDRPPQFFSLIARENRLKLLQDLVPCPTYWPLFHILKPASLKASLLCPAKCSTFHFSANSSEVDQPTANSRPFSQSSHRAQRILAPANQSVPLITISINCHFHSCKFLHSFQFSSLRQSSALPPLRDVAFAQPSFQPFTVRETSRRFQRQDPELKPSTLLSAVSLSLIHDSLSISILSTSLSK